MRVKIRLKLLFFLLNCGFISASNYCDLCKDHIACNNEGKFDKSCPKNAKLLPLSNTEIETILSAHNYVRNKIAGGDEPRHPKASGMMALVGIKKRAKMF